jgi:ankyrin repeat protein
LSKGKLYIVAFFSMFIVFIPIMFSRAHPPTPKSTADTRSMERVIKNNDIDSLKTLIENYVDYDSPIVCVDKETFGIEFKYGSFLMLAAALNNLEVGRLLLENNTKISTRSHSSGTMYSAIDVATLLGHDKFVKLLLEYESPLSNSIKFAFSRNNRKILKLLYNHNKVPEENQRKAFLVLDVIKAIDNGDLDIVKEIYPLSENPKKNYNFKGVTFTTLINYAAAKGKLEIVKFFHSNGFSIEVDKWGHSILTMAIKYGYNDVLKYALENGHSGDPHKNRRSTYLTDVINKDNYEALKFLLKYNANPNYAIRVPEYTPLGEAVRKSNKQIVDLLIKHGADVNIKDRYKETPLDKAIREDNLEMVKYLIEEKNAEYKSHFGIACAGGNLEIIEYLLSKNASIKKADNYPFHPLYFAVRNDDHNLLNLLIENGVDVNEKASDDLNSYHSDKNHPTCLMYAFQENKNHIATILYNTGKCKNSNQQIFSAALLHNAFDICDQLKDSINFIEKDYLHLNYDLNYRLNDNYNYRIGSDDNELLKKVSKYKKEKMDYCKYLYHALKSGTKSSVEYIVNNNLYEKSVVNEYVDYYIYAALFGNKFENLNYFIDLGFNPTDSIVFNKFVFKKAIEKKNIKLFKQSVNVYSDNQDFLEKAMLELFTQPEREYINILIPMLKDKNVFSKCLYNLANAYKNKNTDYELVEILILNGADVNYHTSESSPKSTLYAASRRNNINLVKWLIEHGAKPNFDKKDNSLNSAASLDNIEIVKFLHEQFPNITNVQRGKVLHNCSTTTVAKFLIKKGVINEALSEALVYASLHGEGELVLLLLENGADPNYKLKDNKGDALSFAKKRKKYEVVKILKEHGAKEK